ncbi:N-acetylmuramoyl-L-alanine amidase [Pseudoroseicyclus aestuarii]|uniref:N-acetylmuramoyl-L-alanine amidase n=1 Tax=Pseudoroseicyclus aestuarii TaxID=1795041 RepID=A0A318T1D8_9RHOB|nr:N-acetylmuramoyl-L-alanine amidase [Pseudoroseicyclus aestuarii]PYE85787.1 N-acetylmuramoyl-L-alanine amidase [Pseudoroseicyclus aestuarii]
MQGLALRRLAGLVLVLLALLTGAARAQEFSGLARLEPGESRIADEGRGLALDLALDQAVPWRLYLLDAPRRLVVELSELDLSPLEEGILAPGRGVALRAGRGAPGWSRLVLDLAEPLLIEQAEMRVARSGAARLRASLRPVSAEAFAEAARPEPAQAAPGQPERPEPGPLTVAIDPGHGGRDPGAQRAGLSEKDLMLTLAQELGEAMRRAGLGVVLTRESDVFVPLEDRITRAREGGADLLISLHADALEEDEASGASVYTLSAAGRDGASERMAERHNPADLLSGLDLTGQDDTVATALMDLARVQTSPQSARLANAVVDGLREAGASVNDHAHRVALLAVLLAADIPSVLVETGFLSDPADRAALSTPQGRAPIVAGMTRAVQVWAAEEAARAPLLRR